MIKAIETQYKGYKFRSRLEARWAVFFDAMNIEYQYEVEGFDLDGVWYLPDFYLPRFNCWVEVKGNTKSFDEDMQKLTNLCYANNAIGLFLGGDPVDSFDDTESFKLICGDITDSSGGECEERFCFCHNNGEPMLLPESVGDGMRGRDYFTVNLDDVYGIIDMPYTRVAPEGITMSMANKAAIKARQARFEHGECP